MIASEKYYLEVQLDLVIEVPIDEKIELIKKINSTINRMLKDKKVIHYSSNLSSVSEDVLVSAYVANAAIEAGS